MDSVLAKLDIARTALAEAKTIQETKQIMDVAAAAEIYAKRQKLGEEAVQYATAIKLEALRQLGNMLKETPRNGGTKFVGGNRFSGGTHWELPENTPTLAELGIDKKTSSLAQKVAELPERQFEAVISGVATLTDALNKTIPHVSYNGGENEWYTPPEFIEAARRVMGRIDTDPASSEIANRTVKAGVYYDKQANGLDRVWAGNVWMNPPYSGDLIGRFCDKLADEYQADHVVSAIVLVNNATETNWFYTLVGIASAVVFTKGRVRFLDPLGNRSGAPLQGQAIIYIGGQVDVFLREFSPFGWGARL